MAAMKKKLVIVGDSSCGKTRLLFTISRGRYVDDEVRLAFQDYEAEITIEEKLMKFDLVDTPGLEDYDLIRTLSYEDTDIVLVCFAVDNQDSLSNISKKWILEVEKYCPGVPVILVGNKKDLRDFGEADNRPNLVNPEEGMLLAEKIGAHSYLECSAKTFDGVHQVFDTAARLTLQFPKNVAVKRINDD
ncbi:ras-like GTP-binding protein RHO [Uloborus diversus]|uniref:ras-like GTP-binding protein RHO n=1 Tax=Uloborus diversus TaxID=327109 RepID=UPI002409AD3E|nr:ras-like GTP-binding protein RHO [Uloborus diversus]